MNREQLKKNLLNLLASKSFFDFYKEEGIYTSYISREFPPNSAEAKENEKEVEAQIELMVSRLLSK